MCRRRNAPSARLGLMVGCLATGAAQAGWLQAPLALWVNGEERGVKTVWMSEAGEVCLPRGLLQDLGIRPWAAPVDERDCLSPAGDGRVRSHLVVRRAELRLEVDPRLLEATRRGRGPVRREPAPWVDSAFLNYALERQSSSQGSRTRVPLEAVVNSHGWSLESHLTLDRSPEAPWEMRGLQSRLLHDRPERRERWALGQVTAPGGSLLAARPLVGGGVARHAEMDPDLLRYDGVTVSGLASTPSTVEVWMDGRLLAREQVPPGPFQLQDLPAGGGRQAGRVVVRDAFGRERTQALDLYTPTRPLTRLERDYAFYLGRVETDASPYASGRYRRALSRALQAGVWGAAGTAQAVAGVEALLVPARRGEVLLQLARSRYGGAGSVDYAYVGRRWRLALTLGMRTRGYWDGAGLAQAPTLRARASLGISAGSLGNWSLAWQRMQDADTQDRLTLFQQRRLWRGAAYTLRLDGGPGSGAVRGLLTLNWWLGRGRGLGVSGIQGAGGGDRQLWMQQARRPALATDWRLALGQDAAGRQYDARLGRNFQHLRVEGEGWTQAGVAQTRLRLAGSLVFASERWHLARPVREAFALVETPGFDGVPVYLRQGYQGRTRGGRLLVPDLSAYAGNPLKLDDGGLPVNVIPQRTQATLVPRYHQGVVTRFPLRRIQAVSGTLVDAQGAPLSLDHLVLETPSGPRSGVVGRGGVFYLEDLPPGTYGGRLAGHDCRFRLHVPAQDGVIVETGKVRCQ